MPARDKPNRQYTATQKAQAVGTALVVGPNRAGRQLGIPHNNISMWMKDERYSGLRDAAREEVAAQLWVGVQVAVASVVEAFGDPQATLKDKAVALGIIYDKHALITGGATNRSESRDISGTLSDSELIAAVREAGRITSDRRAEAETAGPPEGEGV